MPANALSIESREFTKFNATRQEGRIDIQGEYTVTVKNGGLLPVPGASLNVNTLQTPDSGVEIISQEQASIGTISGGQTADVTVKFNASASQNDLLNFAGTACQGDSVSAKVQENVSGLLLAIAFDDSVDITSSQSDCMLGGGPPATQPGPQPEPQPEPEPRPEPEPEPRPPGGRPEPEPEPEPEPPEEQTVDITGPENPTAGEEVEYTVRDAPSSADSFLWSDSGQDSDLSNDPRDDTYRTRFDEAGLQRVSVSVRDEFGRQVAEGELNFEAEEPRDTGDDRDRGDDRDDGRDDDRGGGGGGEDQPDTSGEITGPELVVVDESNEWEWTGQQNWDSRIYTLHWSMSEGGGFDYEGMYTRPAVTHTYDFQGPKTIRFEVQRQDDDSVVVSDEYSIEVINPATGGLTSGVPSMDEAAAMKTREY
jgi:hypothetical protein